MVVTEEWIITQTDTSMRHDRIVDEDSNIVLGGTKHTRIDHGPCWEITGLPTQDALLTRSPRKNQHVTAANMSIIFVCLASLDDINFGMFLFPLTMGILCTLVGIAYNSILQDANKQVCSITFAEPAIASQAALELNTKGLPGIFLVVATYESPPPMPLTWNQQTIPSLCLCIVLFAIAHATAPTTSDDLQVVIRGILSHFHPF